MSGYEKLQKVPPRSVKADFEKVFGQLTYLSSQVKDLATKKTASDLPPAIPNVIYVDKIKGELDQLEDECKERLKPMVIIGQVRSLLRSIK